MTELNKNENSKQTDQPEQCDAKFEEELTCQSKTDMSNLTNFDASTRKSQNFPL